MTRQLHLTWTALRPHRPVPGRGLFDVATTPLRVHPGDLDMYRHVNNGVYLQFMDIARTQLLAGTGGLRRLMDNGWYPVVVASTMTYRRSLTLGQRFTIESRVLGWDTRVVFVEQVFVRAGEHVARGVVAGRFLARSGPRPTPQEVAELIAGGPVASPTLPEDVTAWARALDVLHRTGEV
ncbi:MAG: acyl-CoA thioesterase [Actinobacteria bacterium]|nr:acyl-CoA thioesterase [Actinomycetota bacterium]MCG2798311.1 acyl-CoA thioesterase [Cellulomonas sp.]